MKKIEKSVILAISLIALGAICTSIYFVLSQKEKFPVYHIEKNNEENNNIGLNINYEDYPVESSLDFKTNYMIINNYEKLKLLFVSSDTQYNPDKDKKVNKILNKYKNYDFSKNQLVALNTSGSYCNKSDIKTNLNLKVENNTLVITHLNAEEPVLCQAFMYQTTIIEINLTNIESVSIK